jgi:hypothetical protein
MAMKQGERRQPMWGVIIGLVICVGAIKSCESPRPSSDHSVASRSHKSGSDAVDGMTQAAKDAGYDDATARQIGREAAALCNGNPECMK